MPDPIWTPSIFLDTNAIHNVTSYLIQARKLKLPPYQPEADIKNVREKLRKKLPKNMADLLVNGLCILVYLQSQSENFSAQIFTSRFAFSEMWYGRLDGQAHIRMSLEGVPYRQRQRQGDISELVMANLTQKDYELVEKELDSLLQGLKREFGITISFVEDIGSPDFREISLLSLEIQKRTFLDVIDCTLYACSLAVRATEFITSDGHLFKVINQIRKPGDIEDLNERILWENVQRDILAELKILHLDDGITVDDLVKPTRPNSLGDNISQLHRIKEMRGFFRRKKAIS
jgi:hypothetical protein